MRSLVAFPAILVLAAPSVAQPLVRGQPAQVSLAVELGEVDNAARAHLERVDRFLEAGEWDEAVETLRRLMDTDGEKMIPVDDGPARARGFVRFVPLRDYCQLKLGGLRASAPGALELYRNRVDSLARRWYEEAAARNDTALLRRIVDRFFMSSYGDDALFRLGEIELERGNYTWARSWWERISPLLRMPSSGAAALGGLPGRPLWPALRAVDLNEQWGTVQPLLQRAEAPSGWLAYPDTDLDLAAVRARLVLVSILENSTERGEAELALLARVAGNAEGTIGGRRGRYVDLLADWLAHSRTWAVPPAPPGWRTFGGAPGRGKVMPHGVDIALRPIWTAPLSRRRAGRQENPWTSDSMRVAEDAAGLLSYHPVVVDDVVVVTTGEAIESVQAFDLHTGQPLWPASAAKQTAEGPRRAHRRLRWMEPLGRCGVPRFTMTADEGILYVKLGSQATIVPRSDRYEPPPAGYLVALDLRAQKKRLFEIHLAPKDWGDGWAFEGAPVVHQGRLYVVLRRRDNLRAQCHVACFQIKAHRADLRWRRFIAAAETVGQGRCIEYTHTLLAMDQGRLYVNSNLGAVAALRADDGQIRWIARYPRTAVFDGDPDRSRRHLYRDLNPCLIFKDRIFVAPTDCDQIFALDAATGMMLWTAGPGRAADAVHLLGVGGRHLVASGDRLYWIDIDDGRLVSRFPERVQDALRGYGRGVLAGHEIYWPTRDRIYIFDQDGMRQRRQPIDLAPLGATGGNLVIADDVLLIAGADRLVAFGAARTDRLRAD